MTEPRVIASVTAHATEDRDGEQVERTYVLRLDFPTIGPADFDHSVDTAIQAAAATGMLHDAVRRVVVECEYTDATERRHG